MLPYVNKVQLWRPINKSVIIKLRIKTGINLSPKINGTYKLNAIRLVKFGGWGTNLLAAKTMKIPNEIFK